MTTVAPTVANVPVHLSPNQRAWRRFWKNRAAVVSAVFLVVFVGLILLWPLVSSINPNSVSDAQFAKPNSHYFFGTDVHGRDLLARICYGARISLLVGIVGAAVSLIIGVSWGLVSGYAG